ncbi:tyrosine-type recombinase/integrase [Mameliella alba]|uniref:Phage integrase family protein n=1 Tax=Mameliella alba TaxID=561184 RepID=A0A0B3RQZ7_9RHOB|nr:tyrosine-type recombinase/integrase [Mameliella alba]KHQ50317.1 Phage integrase family protein [Mameliella alba]
MTKAPFDKLPRGLGLRQRKRSDGSWRVWWEPTGAERAEGAAPAELDAARPTWSLREAKRLKAEATGQAQPAPVSSGGRTIAALVETYKRAPRFGKLADATRTGYEADFRVIVEKWGTQPVASFTKPVIYTWWETLHGRSPTYAGKLIRSFSVLFTHAERLGWRPENSNPCRGLGMPGATRRKRHASWAEIDALLTTAERLDMHNMACGIALALFTGQRQSDVAGARIADMHRSNTLQLDGSPVTVWHLRRSKRGNLGSVPLHPEAAARVQALIDAAPEDEEQLLRDEATGQPYSLDLFRKRWASIRAAASKSCPSLLRPALQFRDLRRTFGVLARAAGALREDVADVLGNSADTNAGLGEVYMPSQFDTALRAVQAIKRPDTEGRKKSS